MASRKISLKIICGIAFAILFLSPYVVISFQFLGPLDFDQNNLIWALKNTLFQAIGSALMTLTLGVFGGLGLIWLRRVIKNYRYLWIENLLLIPNLLPSLFVVVSCLGIFKKFPFGITGIIIIHTITNVGLVSVLWSHILVNKLGTMAELALIEGAGFWRFFKVGVLGYLKRDFFFLFIFVFSSALVSFSVPLLVGGASGTTLEVLIYENLVIHRNWAQALMLTLIQMVIVGVFSIFRSQSVGSVDQKSRVSCHLSIVEFKWGLLVPIFSVAVVIFPPLFALRNGLLQLKSIEIEVLQLLKLGLHSVILGFAVGVFLLFLSLYSCYNFQNEGWRKYINFYLPPGATLIGFSFFAMDQWFSMSLNMKLIWGLSILFFPGLYKLILVSPLDKILGQIEISKVLGATSESTFKKIILPQLIKPLFTVASIGSLWASGDFALSSIVSSEDFHLALIIKSLAASYRLEAAQILIFFLILISGTLYFFWWRLGDVLSRKFDC